MWFSDSQQKNRAGAVQLLLNSDKVNNEVYQNIMKII